MALSVLVAWILSYREWWDMCLCWNTTGQEEALKKLVRHSSAFEEADQEGWLPVHEAAGQLNKNILEITLKGTKSF